MQQEETLTDLLTALEKSVRRVRIEYSKEITDRIKTEFESDKQAKTIRLLRRQVRRQKKLLKAKDRLLASQKSFYEEMNRFNETKAKTDGKKIESAVYECLKRILINGIETN